jgi:LmbE family N-acetylglucosaminyl deacetylase
MATLVSPATTVAAPARVSAFIEQYRGRTVLAAGSHPNDIEAGAGGTLARLADTGARVVNVIVCVPHHLEQRMAEARNAARVLGAELRFLHAEREQRVEDIKFYELIDEFDRLVRELDPAVVFTHAASNFHQDNVLVHKAFIAAQRLHFFDMFCFYPTNCHPVTTPFHPTAYVDITTTVDRKLEAINEYKTQFTCRGIATDVYRGAAAEYGRLAGVPWAEGLEIARLSLG